MKVTPSRPQDLGIAAEVSRSRYLVGVAGILHRTKIDNLAALAKLR
jgi:hypothetical protein